MASNGRIVQHFTEWLDKHEIEYRIDLAHDDLRVYVNYPDGWYIRVSNFENGLQWYVRDNGMVYWASVFELADRILEQKLESKSNAEKIKEGKMSDLHKAWLKGDMKAIGDILKADGKW